MNKPIISLVVPTYNRLDEIEILLDSLEKQSLDREKFEIIIIDDGSTDNTSEWVKKYNSPSGLQLNYINQENKGPGAARNNGMENAKGEIFVFVDSDCILPEQYLENILIHYQDESVDAAGGPDRARADFPVIVRAIDYSMTSFLGTGGMRGSKGKELAKFYPRSFNMSFRRIVWEKIGGFNDLRHGQDLDYSNRIYKAGFNVTLMGDNFVYHKRRTSISRFFKQVFNWGVARVNLFLNDNQMLEPLHAAPAVGFATFVLLILLSPFFQLVEFILYFILSFVALALLYVKFESLVRHRDIRVSLLVMIVLPIQIIAYGLGFLIALWHRIVLKKGEYTGFTKRYYK